MDLTADKLKLEEQLDSTMNSDIDIEIKISRIKQLLYDIVRVDLCLAKFTDITKINNEN